MIHRGNGDTMIKAHGNHGSFATDVIDVFDKGIKTRVSMASFCVRKPSQSNPDAIERLTKMVLHRSLSKHMKTARDVAESRLGWAVIERC